MNIKLINTVGSSWI